MASVVAASMSQVQEEKKASEAVALMRQDWGRKELEVLASAGDTVVFPEEVRVRMVLELVASVRLITASKGRHLRTVSEAAASVHLRQERRASGVAVLLVLEVGAAYLAAKEAVTAAGRKSLVCHLQGDA